MLRSVTDEELIERIPKILDMLLRYAGNPSNEGDTNYPSWCQKIVQRLDSTIFKSFLALCPKDNQMSWEDRGKLFGILARILSFNEHDMPKKLESHFPNEKLANEIKQLTLGDSTTHSCQWLYEAGMKQCAQLNPLEQKDFLLGLAKGQSLFLDEHGEFTGQRGRTGIYFTLLGLYPEIEQKRKEGLTRKELFDWLERKIDLSSNYSFNWFSDVCDDIGLCLRCPGRPQKAPFK